MLADVDVVAVHGVCAARRRVEIGGADGCAFDEVREPYVTVCTVCHNDESVSSDAGSCVLLALLLGSSRWL